MTKSSNKSIIVFGITLLIVIIAFIGVLILTAASTKNSSDPEVLGAKIDIDNAQILKLTAKGGFQPSTLNAKAGKDIILRINTNGTYDCSASISIPSLKISKVLPSDGTTDIPISGQKSGTVINGSCSMGMYHFKIVVS